MICWYYFIMRLCLIRVGSSYVCACILCQIFLKYLGFQVYMWYKTFGLKLYVMLVGLISVYMPWMGLHLWPKNNFTLKMLRKVFCFLCRNGWTLYKFAIGWIWSASMSATQTSQTLPFLGCNALNWLLKRNWMDQQL